VKITLFAGPSVQAADITALVDAEVLPPAARGDLYCAARAGAQAIGLVDGYFACVAAPWHKEILYAMSQGCAVFGAASMGALRAAELAPFGMVGVGEIFRAFVTGDLMDDDEVALVHAPQEDGYRALSEPMANIRATIARAFLEGVIRESLADDLLLVAKGLLYTQRSYDRVLSKLEELRPGDEQVRAFRGWLKSNAVNQKKLDALALCRTLRSLATSETKPREVGYALAHTDSWSNARRQFDARSVTSFEDQPVLDELRILGQFPAIEDAALARNLSARLSPGEDELFARLGSEQLTDEHGVDDAGELAVWLGVQGIPAGSTAPFLRRHGRVLRMKELTRASASSDLIDELRARGRYAELRRRAQNKAELLSRSCQNNTSISGAALSTWYCEAVIGTRSKAIEHLSSRLGFSSTAEFERVALREYMFRQALAEETGGDQRMKVDVLAADRQTSSLQTSTGS
jgi:hypothetical protein